MCMESFNFETNFEIEVNHPQTEVFTKFEAYVGKKTWRIIHSDHKEFISFQTKIALIAITFIANNDNSTTLSITTKTEQFDYNKSVGAIHKILKECFSEQIDNVEEEHKEVQSSNTLSPISSLGDWNTTSIRFSSPLNALSPIFRSVLGQFTLVRPLQTANIPG